MVIQNNVCSMWSSSGVCFGVLVNLFEHAQSKVGKDYFFVELTKFGVSKTKSIKYKYANQKV